MDLPNIDTAITRKTSRGMIGEVSYSGVTSFARCKYTKDLNGVDVAITGIPFDVSVTHRGGSRFGPRQIRELSTMLAWDAPYGWPINPFEAMNIIDYGDCPFDHGKLQLAPAAIENHIKTILDAGAAAVSMGGDHYTTLPNLRAHAAKHGPLSVIQFDAHSDTWVDPDPERIDHGTFMYHAIQEELVAPERSVQVGIRTHNSDTQGFNTIDAPEVHEFGAVRAAKRIKEIVGDNKVYLTFDIDGLDPGFAPGTGTPVFGGLTSGQVALMFRNIAGIKLVGGDVVEVSPAYDTTGATAVAGSQILLEILCLLANK
ncbi:agmatinase [Roseovarius aestuarii]|uniref:Agmatinase n=1 Tax=Roseovarius aestuarii TaxID=475083 RepID=A0A1X7BZF2_9RHOB|nr:agmatinase [Roseovarius aestuarii]SMC14659.1 Agmatinase [Roseovarius aestuarii]